MHISATKQSKDQQKQAIIINKCIKHIRQEETHIYIYEFTVHFTEKANGPRRPTATPATNTPSEKNIPTITGAPLKLRKGRNVLPCCVLVAQGAVYHSHIIWEGETTSPSSEGKNLLPRGIKSSWDDKKEKKKTVAVPPSLWGRVSQRAAPFLIFFRKKSTNV